MKFLGVNWDHPSGASLLKDGEIAAAVSEERFSRRKNDMSFPAKALKFCADADKAGGKTDGVGIASLDVSYTGMMYRYATMSIEDHVREQRQVWYPRLYENKQVDDALVFKDRWDKEQYPKEYWAEYDPAKKATYAKDAANIIADYCGVARDKAVRVEHHWCHAYYAYFCSPYRQGKTLVVTIDGFGDGLNATVSIAEGNELKRIYSTDKCVLGRIYRHMTLILGMKPLEHEFKIMGLAPYAKAKYVMPAFDVFNDVIKLNGIEFEWKNKPKDSYFHFKDKLEGLRFDNIAGGLQLWLETVLCQWVENLVKETGISRLVVGGGVAMNIKAMGKVAMLPCVTELFVAGSGSDDSNCIGAAIGAAAHFNGGKVPGDVRINNLYLGPEVREDLPGVLAKAGANPELAVESDPSDERVCRLLMKGCVLGRCFGAMEFGQRALGNRSILADPTIPELVPKINSMIKNRDFWMPFAPMVLDSYSQRYLVNPKNVASPHMTVGFETTAEGYEAMRAACQPADRSARPQILRRTDNPQMYSLLSKFEQLTGRGAILNTSFNLHGYPIVTNAAEAYDVFLNSELEALLLPGALIVKKKVL